VDAYHMVKGCALPNGNRTCLLEIPAACRESDMKYIKCEMCSDKNGCNKEDWQNGKGKMESSPPPTTTKSSIAPTTTKNDIVTTILPTMTL
jgi:hypothetical protein